RLPVLELFLCGIVSLQILLGLGAWCLAATHSSWSWNLVSRLQILPSIGTWCLGYKFFLVLELDACETLAKLSKFGKTDETWRNCRNLAKPRDVNGVLQGGVVHTLVEYPLTPHHSEV
ncbi:14386_t:CDS:2, partial [Ambispora leptoticha]